MKLNNKLNQKNIITAGCNNDLTVTATSGIIPLTNNKHIGNRLSLLSGKVVVGAGVSKVMVSANMRISTTGSSSLGVNLNILKNDTNYISSNRTSVVANGYDGLSTSSRLVEVQEGDTISMYYWKSSSSQSLKITSDGEYGGTYLTVEVIE